MKCRKPSERHQCALLNKSISWSTCVEVQEVREENMDMDMFAIPFSLEKADKDCTECRWCIISNL